MPDLGWQELIIILIIVVIIFGAGRLPEIGGAMGKSIKEFKKQSDQPDTPNGQPAAVATESLNPVGAKSVDLQIRADEI